MSVGDIWDKVTGALGAAGKALIDGVGAVLGILAKLPIIGGFFEAAGCILGALLIYPVSWFQALLNLGSGQPIPPSVRAAAAPLFPDLDLGNVKIVPNATVIAGSHYGAMTLGSTIYFRGSFFDCNDEDALQLLHELVHVRQFAERSMASFGCNYLFQVLEYQYPGAPYERDANQFVQEHSADFLKALNAACKARVAYAARPLSDWFWLTWG